MLWSFKSTSHFSITPAWFFFFLLDAIFKSLTKILFSVKKKKKRYNWLHPLWVTLMDELLSALETSTWINSWVSSEARSFPFKTMIYKRHHPIPGGKHETSRATHKMHTQGYSWLEVAGGADFWWSPSPQRDTGQEPAPSPERVVKIPRQILFILFQRSIMKYCTKESFKTTLCYLWQIWCFLTQRFI